MTIMEGALNAKINEVFDKFRKLAGSGASGSKEWGQKAQNLQHYRLCRATGWRRGRAP